MTMYAPKKNVILLYADRATQQWIVLDAEGKLWVAPERGQTWDDRQPFEPTAETELELVPGHYAHMLGLSI